MTSALIKIKNKTSKKIILISKIFKNIKKNCYLKKKKIPRQKIKMKIFSTYLDSLFSWYQSQLLLADELQAQQNRHYVPYWNVEWVLSADNQCCLKMVFLSQFVSAAKYRMGLSDVRLEISGLKDGHTAIQGKRCLFL